MRRLERMSKRIEAFSHTKKAKGLFVLLVILAGIGYVFLPWGDDGCPPGILPCPEEPDFSVGYTRIYYCDYNATIELDRMVYIAGNFTLVDRLNNTIGVFHTNQTIILNETSFIYVHLPMNYSLFYADGFQLWGNGFIDTDPIIINIQLKRIQ